MRAGFVNIFGKPNAGKSTLMNELTKEKLSIITAKAQTTRHRVLGIINGEDYQIVFSDTPGIIKPGYLMQDAMMKEVKTALEDADIYVYVAEIGERVEKENIPVDLDNRNHPVIVVINKIDLSTQEEVKKKLEEWKTLLPNAEIIPISALKKFNIDFLLNEIISKLPEHERYYEEDELTDKSERFFVSEIIREKILLNYRKEIPYSVEVQVEAFKEKKDLTSIRAVIYVERETQKYILIGENGKALKKTGTMARKDIEKFLNKHIFLELFVKVDKDWRNNARELKRFGYEI